MDVLALQKEVEHLRHLSDPLLFDKYKETKQRLTVEQEKTEDLQRTLETKNKCIDTLEKEKRSAVEDNDYHLYLYNFCAKDNVQMKKTRDAEIYLSESILNCQRLEEDRLEIENDALQYTYKFSALMAEVQDMVLRATINEHTESMKQVTQQYNDNMQNIYEQHRTNTNELKRSMGTDHQKILQDLHTEWEKKITDATTNAINVSCKIQETEKERDKYKTEMERLNQTLVTTKEQLSNAEERVKLANMIANQAKDAEEKALAIITNGTNITSAKLNSNTVTTKGKAEPSSRKRKTTKDTKEITNTILPTTTPTVVEIHSSSTTTLPSEEMTTASVISAVEKNPIVSLSSVTEEESHATVPTAKKRRIRKVDTKEKLALKTPMTTTKAKEVPPDSVLSLRILDPDTSIEEEFEETRKTKVVVEVSKSSPPKGLSKATKITKNKKERNVIMSPEDNNLPVNTENNQTKPVSMDNSKFSTTVPSTTSTKPREDRFSLPSKLSTKSKEEEGTVRNEEETSVPSLTTTNTKVITQTTLTVPLVPLSVNLNIGSMYPNPFGKMLNVPAFKLPTINKPTIVVPLPPAPTTTLTSTNNYSSSGRLDLPLPNTVPSTTTAPSSNINFKLFKMPKLKGL